MGGRHEDPDRGSARQFSKPVRKKPPKSTAFSSEVWGFLIKKKLNWRGCSSVEEAPCSSQDKSHHPTPLPLTRDVSQACQEESSCSNPAGIRLLGNPSLAILQRHCQGHAQQGWAGMGRDGQGWRCRLGLSRSLRPGKPR